MRADNARLEIPRRHEASDKEPEEAPEEECASGSREHTGSYIDKNNLCKLRRQPLQRRKKQAHEDPQYIRTNCQGTSIVLFSPKAAWKMYSHGPTRTDMERIILPS
ncbi:hypothetical protein Y1Q_0005516 [Alligator mississippiensis]|uniref:Uncharacterized protein n=1 Tax=Alligator mississippiensis TaxID=8496 RepID=A0A151MET6_ALLMI|nr:hypothetical protein Y1Q_0005516 [Alligator mississippiensis]